MNILFLSELFYPHGGGAELATYLYADLLSRKGVNIVVFTNRFPGEPATSRNGRLRIYRLDILGGNRNSKYSITQAVVTLFSGLIKRYLLWADIVYIPRFWFSAIPLAKTCSKPVIVHLHDFIPSCPLTTLFNVSKEQICAFKGPFCPLKCIYSYEREAGNGLVETLTSVVLNSTLGRQLGRVINLSDALICVSEAQKSLIAERTPLLHDKLSVISNPIQHLPFNGIEGGDFAYFGGPGRLKGFETLCHALLGMEGSEHLRVQVTNFPTSMDGKIILLNKAEIVLHQRLNMANIGKLYDSLRAVIVPSLLPETYSYTICEAILRGRLVIASNIGAIPEVTKNCKGVFLFKPGDRKELRSKLEHVCNMSKEVVFNLVEQDRFTFLKRFNNETTSNDFLSLCDRLLR